MTEKDDAPSRREAELAREVSEAQLDAKFVEITARLDAMRQALALTEQFPTDLDEAVRHVREFYDERFTWMKALLEEQHRSEKEARGIAERSMRDQLVSLGATLESRNENTMNMVSALEKQVTRLESERSGGQHRRDEARDKLAVAISIFAVLIAVLAVVARVLW